MFYKAEIEVRLNEIWEHIESGMVFAVEKTLPNEVQLVRDGDITCETPQAFLSNYRLVSSATRGVSLVADVPYPI